MSEPCMFAQIDNVINQIDNVKKYLDNAFTALQNSTQERVDSIIEEDINPTVNAKLADMRATLLSSLQQQYQAFQAFSQSLEPISSGEPTNLSKVIEFCFAVKDFLVGAYSTLMQFMTQLTAHLVSLTAAIESISGYTPPIQGISFDKLDIHMEPITMADITGEI